MDETHVQQFVWSTSLTEILVSSLLDLYHDSYWHMEKGFKNGYYNELAKRVKIVAPNCGVLGKPHVESALKMLRTYTLAYHELLTKGSGFSFNYSTHTIEIYEISWKEWKKVYCGSRATGVEEIMAYAEREAILGEGIVGASLPHETHVPDDTQQVSSYMAPTPPSPRVHFSSSTPIGSSSQKKRKTNFHTSLDGVAENIHEMVEASQNQTDQLVDAILQASSSHTKTREVQKFMEFLGVTDLSMDEMLAAADMIILDDAKRTTFLALPEGMRVHWLYKHLNN